MEIPAALTIACGVLAALVGAVGMIHATTPTGLSAAEAELWATEEAFASTMAGRDHEAFSGFLDPETVFCTGTTTLRGRAAVATAWQRYFEADEAPFSWAPEVVAVLESGQLGRPPGRSSIPTAIGSVRSTQCGVALPTVAGGLSSIAAVRRTRCRASQCRGRASPGVAAAGGDAGLSATGAGTGSVSGWRRDGSLQTFRSLVSVS